MALKRINKVSRVSFLYGRVEGGGRERKGREGKEEGREGEELVSLERASNALSLTTK